MHSCDRKRDALEWNGFAVFEPISKHPQRQRLGFGLRLFLAAAVHVHTGQVGHLGDPPSIALPIHLDTESHAGRVPDLAPAAQRQMPLCSVEST